VQSCTDWINKLNIEIDKVASQHFAPRLNRSCLALLQVLDITKTMLDLYDSYAKFKVPRCLDSFVHLDCAAGSCLLLFPLLFLLAPSPAAPHTARPRNRDDDRDSGLAVPAAACDLCGAARCGPGSGWQQW
jgi:hypothetical protein